MAVKRLLLLLLCTYRGHGCIHSKHAMVQVWMVCTGVNGVYRCEWHAQVWMACVLQGQYKSTVMCQRCGRKSVVFEPFVCLPLEIPSPTRCSLAVSATDRHTHTHYMYLVVQCCSLCCVSIHSKLWAQWLTETGCTHTHTDVVVYCIVLATV